MQFKREDWRLFCSLNTLCQKAGVGRSQILPLVVKEVVDNALDVDPFATLDYIDKGFIVTNIEKEGLSKEQIEDIFRPNRELISTKLLRLPSRGALGNGIRVITGAVISTLGTMFVSSQGKKYELKFDDQGQSEAVFVSDAEEGTTVIEIKFGYMDFDEDDLFWGRNSILFSRGKLYKKKTNPHWYSTENVHDVMLAVNEEMTLRELLTSFQLTKNQLQETMFDIIDACIELDMKCNDITLKEANIILDAMKYHGKEMKGTSLGRVKESRDDNFLNQYGYAHGCDSFIMKSYKGGTNAQIPFVVEAFVRTKREESGKGQFGLFINRTNAIVDISLGKDGKTKGYIYGNGLNMLIPDCRHTVYVSIITPYMPIKSDGKDPDLSYMNGVVEKIVCKAIRQAQRMYKDENSTFQSKLSEKDIYFLFMKDGVEKSSGGSKYRFSQRQLFYALRPYIIERLDKEPNYNYFCNVLTKYENLFGDIKKIYRDERGIMYEPHTGREISIGTLAVEDYDRPEFTFNKILYIEKQGFFSILKDEKFPEKYDCALLTSKGFATRAVKDLIDMMDDTGEPIQVFCVHDADASGTLIYETLQEATLSRGRRKVEIINLGLDVEEAIEMGLDIEKTNRKTKASVAEYIKERDYDDYYHNGICDAYFEYEDDIDIEPRSFREDWLSKYRVELNAMSTPVFIEWIEEKMEEHGCGKVLPSTDVIDQEVKTNLESVLRQQIMDQLMEENNFEELLVEKMSDIVENKLNDFNSRHYTYKKLGDSNAVSWRDSAKDIAKLLVNEN